MDIIGFLIYLYIGGKDLHYLSVGKQLKINSNTYFVYLDAYIIYAWIMMTRTILVWGILTQSDVCWNMLTTSSVAWLLTQKKKCGLAYTLGY